MVNGKWQLGWLVIPLLILLPGAAMGEERGGRGSSGGMVPGNGSRIYGQELMTPTERETYQGQLWEQKTERDREQFRDRHREKMQERARNLGVPLVDETLEGKKTGEEPVKRSDDGLRRWPDDAHRERGVRQWTPAADAARRPWPEKREEKDWRRSGPPEPNPAQGTRKQKSAPGE